MEEAPNFAVPIQRPGHTDADKMKVRRNGENPQGRPTDRPTIRALIGPELRLEAVTMNAGGALGNSGTSSAGERAI